LHRIGYTDCDGPLDAAHLAPKQRLKALYKTRGMPAHQIAAAVWDARVTVPICRRHHTLFDQKVIRLTEDQFPPKMLEYAAEYGLEYRGARDAWTGSYVSPEDAA
jgi:hypothetical protein